MNLKGGLYDKVSPTTSCLQQKYVVSLQNVGIAYYVVNAVFD